MADIDAYILAGGMGTRLRSVVDDRPKVLAPVAGKPFLHYLLKQLEDGGFRHAVIGLGYMGEAIRTVFGDRHGTVALTYVAEQTPRGTAGALRLAVHRLHSDPVLVLNGDSFLDMQLPEFVSWHHHGAHTNSLAMCHVEDCSRYGVLRLHGEGRVQEFVEKAAAAREPGWVNGGVYLLSKALIEAIPAGRDVSLEREVFPGVAAQGALSAYRCAGDLIDIGTPASYHRAQTWFGTRPSGLTGADHGGIWSEARHR